MRRHLLHGLTALLLAVSGMTLAACDEADEAELDDAEVEVED